MQHVDVYHSEADAAYQGAPGAYSEQAARALLGSTARLMPCATLEQAVDAVVDGRALHAVVPVEDALSGSVPAVYEILLSRNLVVTGETVMNIDHVLVAQPGATLRNIRRVMSHPIALAQCSDFFRQHRHIEAVSVFDTAGAVRIVMQGGDPTVAAIASRDAAALYGAAILAEHVQDHAENWTRFLLIANPEHTAPVSEPQKAIVAFRLRHEPGALVRALQVIAQHGLSITKIEGRPVPGTTPPFDYRFVVEMIAPEGRSIPPDIGDALRGAVIWFKPLGAFRTR